MANIIETVQLAGKFKYTGFLKILCIRKIIPPKFKQLITLMIKQYHKILEFMFKLRNFKYLLGKSRVSQRCIPDIMILILRMTVNI